MKKPLLRHLCFLAGTFALLGQATPAAAQTSFTWNATAGNWSDGTKWSTGTAPTADGLSTVTIDGGTTAFTTTADTTWSAAGSIAGLIFAPTSVTSGSAFTTGLASTGSNPLTIGAGGITLNANTAVGAVAQTLNITAPLVLGSSQTWTVNGGTTLQLNSSAFSDSSSSVVLTKTGTGTLTLKNTASTLNGTVDLNQGTISLSTSTILGQLGTAGIKWENNGNTTLSVLAFAAGGQLANGNFSNNIAFNDLGNSNSFTLQSGSAGVGSTLTFSGTWSGALAHQLIFLTSGVTVNNFTTGLTQITGNNSGLTSTSNIWFRDGVYVLANANALGANNSLSYLVGNGSGTSPTLAGLLATSGSNVTGALATNFSNGGMPMLAEFGLSGTGAVTFSGTLALVASSSGITPTTFLTAGPSGTATFSSNIADNGSSTDAPIVIRGGGEVVLSNAAGTAYHGGTTVGGGTTLAVQNTSGSGTGSGAVVVGYGAAAPTATTTASSASVTVSSTAGLAVGQSITGTGITAGTVITSINAGTSTITISQIATASGTGVALAAAADTGILGGSGIVRPSGTNAITVASGSSVYPGAGGAVPTTLSLDGGLTTAPLLTMQSGAAFTFNLGASNASDLVKFLNFATGDLVLNSNALNFTGAQAGTFTLMQFYADGGTTLAADGISSGLVLGTGLSGFNATLNYDATDISLVLTAAPEPPAGALALLALALLAGVRARALRRREALA